MAFAVSAALPALAALPTETPSSLGTKDAAPARVEIVGSAEQYDARREDTTTKIVVSQEEIKKYGDTTLADVLKRQPGISISGGGPAGGGEIRMRGLGTGYTQILLNGDAAPSGFSLDSLSPDLVERIEIVRAGTAEFSARAIAGTINIILKRKVQAGKRELKLRAERSNVFFSPTATLQISDKLDRMSYTVGAEMRYGRFEQRYDQVEDTVDAAANPSLLRRATVQNDGSFRSFSLTPRVNLALPDGDSLSSQSFVRVQRSDSDSNRHWSAELGSLPTYPVDHTMPEDSRSQLRTDLSWIHKLSEGKKLDTKFGLNANRVRSRQHELGHDTTGQQQLDRDVHNDVDGHGGTFTGKYSMPYGGDHQLSAGWDAAHQSTEVARSEDELQGFGLIPVRQFQQYDASLGRLALYGQDEWSITPKLSSYFGVRWETLRTSSEGNNYAAIRNTSNVFSPTFQSVWKLPESTQDQMRLALTRTYRNPDLERLLPRVTQSLNNSPVNPDSIGNPALRPELARGIDVSLERYGSNGAQMSVSVYARRISGYVINSTRLIDGRWQTMPGNDGDARTSGIEFDAKFPLSLLFANANKYNAHMNMARNWSNVSNVPGPDNRLAGQTPFTANVGMDYSMGNAFSSGANFTFKNGGPLRISQTTSTYSTVKRELDIYALWKYSPKTQLRLTAANLLAEPSTEITRYTDAAGSMRRTSVYPFSAVVRLALETQF